MNYKYILFDFDGTVVDTIKGTRDSALYALSKFGIDERNNTVLGKIFSGPPIKESFSKYNLTPEEIDKAAMYYRNYQAENTIECNSTYDGMKELLVELNNKGKKCYVVTAKLESTAKKILKYLGLDEYFELVVGATTDGSRTKKNDILKFEKQVQKLEIKDLIGQIDNFNSSEAVIIGDRPSDIKAGINNNIDSIGVLYGMDTIENLQDAKYLVNTPFEIMDIIK